MINTYRHPKTISSLVRLFVYKTRDLDKRAIHKVATTSSLAKFCYPSFHTMRAGCTGRNSVFALSVLIFYALFTEAIIDTVKAAHPPLERTSTTIAGDARFITPPSDFNPATPYTVATHIPIVDYLIYPTNYSMAHWGEGAVHSNGKVYTAIGDHGGINGNTYLYEYDPASKRMRVVADLQEAVEGFKPTDFGFGKIHGRIDEGRDGNLYFASWWGDKDEGHKYVGDRIFHYNPNTEEIIDHGVTLPGYGAPSTRLNPVDMLLYLEIQNFFDKNDIYFVVYDLKSDRIIFQGEHPFRGIRDMFVDADGNAYFNVGEGALRRYDPKTNTVSDFSAKMPHGMVQRATQPDSNGIMYGASGWPIFGSQDVLFRVDPTNETIDTVTELWSETAAMSLDPTGRYVYYVASGKKGNYVPGLPIVQMDLHNGAKQKVIAFLEDVMIDEFGYKPYTYNAVMSFNLMLSKDGRTIYVQYNSAPNNGKRETSFLAIHIPEGEAVFPEVKNHVIEVDVMARIRRKQPRMITVKIFGSADFDVLQIDRDTLRFRPTMARQVRGWRIVDSNDDGFIDLQSKFRIRRSAEACGRICIAISGETYSGDKFVGKDTVRSRYCKKKGEQNRWIRNKERN